VGALVYGVLNHLVLVGDDTAIPAIGTVLEAIPPDTRTTVIIEVVDEDDERSPSEMIRPDMATSRYRRNRHGDPEPESDPFNRGASRCVLVGCRRTRGRPQDQRFTRFRTRSRKRPNLSQRILVPRADRSQEPERILRSDINSTRLPQLRARAAKARRPACPTHPNRPSVQQDAARTTPSR